MNKRVWFHRSRSLAWAVVATVAWPLGWLNSVVLVSLASLYANVASDWAASEAADDHTILDRLHGMESRMSVRPARRLGTARPTTRRRLCR